ncbi:HlyD family secretion protein [Rhizobium grahamii]|uniref:Hemolysin D n=1 Tax=Rhizobium grahamii TaxID=1120045 RepID=A0A370KLV3_9HYPH|nr:HlyD family secretion protein [Rhizobium grahamii]RDJ08695.1 hemolysin D [Rhizobium grahamii]
MSKLHKTGAVIETPVENKDPPAVELRAVESAPIETKIAPADRGAEGSATVTPPVSSRGLGRFVIPLTAVGVVLGLVAATSDRWNAWQGSAAVQVTDNATVRAEATKLSARVSGNIKQIAVHDFQHVRSGDLLMEIEPADYDALVAQAEASVAAARAVVDNLENQKAYQRSLIAQAEAQHGSALARLLETEQERERQKSLLQGKVGTPQKLEQAISAYDTARAAVTASDATIDAQRRQLEVLNGQEGLLIANRAAAAAALKTAQLRQGYTRIIAPVDGVVGERLVQEGDYVNVGTQLIVVVPLPDVHVIANYKETQLTHVAAGQPVDITVDMFPDVVLRGQVARLSPASGSTFALLPPDNATGNFTKVVQRIPVRVEFDAGQPMVEKLRPGMSVVTRIYVTGKQTPPKDQSDGN